MSLTPETLTRHELNGLPVRVVDAASDDYVGIGGRVVLETMQTLHVDCGAASPPRDGDGGAVDDGARVRQVPKRGTTFEFRLPNDEHDADDSASAHTDEAADVREASGSASQLGSETAGVRPGQSGPSAATPRQGSGASQTGGDSAQGECKDAVYVTVDGAQLLSRPATRTERAGDSTWH